jgi:hypothetical protein
MFAALQLLCIVVALGCLTMALCIVVLRMQRVRSQLVWCEPQQRQTTVVFLERRQSGTVERAVFHCPLRPFGERCSGTCLGLPDRCPLTGGEEASGTRRLA